MASEHVAAEERAPEAGRAPSGVSARAGYMPIPLSKVPCSAFTGIGVFLRNEEARSEDDQYTLYRGADLAFEEEDRQRLVRSGVRCVFVRIADHDQFRRQMEAALPDVVGDTTLPVAEKAAIVYETSLELINEVLADADLDAHSERLANLSRSITTLVLSDKQAFSQLFATSRHDFYTATHMVNVGTWIVPLACALGQRNPEELSLICQAGLLHDIGKTFVPTEILNKTGKLTEEEWVRMQRHVLLGWEHMQLIDHVPQLVSDVCRQHHERMDGSGYPDGLPGDQIHAVSRMCAVVDSFDAMTALRPFKSKAKSVSEAMIILRSEAPAKYDPEVVEAWLRLLARVSDRELTGGGAPEASRAGGGRERRRYQRFECNCPARLEVLSKAQDGSLFSVDGMEVTILNVSRFGLGISSRRHIRKGSQVLVTFTMPNRQGRRVRGKIVRSEARDDGTCDVGVELLPTGGASG